MFDWYSRSGQGALALLSDGSAALMAVPHIPHVRVTKPLTFGTKRGQVEGPGREPRSRCTPNSRRRGRFQALSVRPGYPPTKTWKSSLPVIGHVAQAAAVGPARRALYRHVQRLSHRGRRESPSRTGHGCGRGGRNRGEGSHEGGQHDLDLRVGQRVAFQPSRTAARGQPDGRNQAGTSTLREGFIRFISASVVLGRGPSATRRLTPREQVTCPTWPGGASGSPPISPPSP